MSEELNPPPPRVGIVIPYLGELPPYFELFAHSCRPFPELDFLILTDSRRQPTTPPNVKLLSTSLGALEQLATARLGHPVRLAHAYKLTDLKPMYGEIFADLLAPYEYWGYGDIDQVLSPTLRRFLEQGLSQGYDVLNTHFTFVHGAFALFKNTARTRELFRSSRDWRAVLDTDEFVAFDECGKKGLRLARALGSRSTHCNTGGSFTEMDWSRLIELQDFECFTTVVCREVGRGLRVLQSHRAKECLQPGETVWIEPDGIRDNRGQSYDSYHWVWDKTRRAFHYPRWAEVPDRYYVSRAGFFDPRFRRQNWCRFVYRWSRALLLLARDRTTYWLHRHLGVTLDQRWRDQTCFR